MWVNLTNRSDVLLALGCENVRRTSQQEIDVDQ